MPKVNRYVDIDTVEKEAKKDAAFAVNVKVGNEYTHPDDLDHYIKSVALYNGTTLLGEASFPAGLLGGQGAKGNLEVTFNVVPTGSKLTLTAMAYCTKHGIWESDPVEVVVEG